MLSQLQIALIFVVISTGFYWFVRIAQASSSTSWRLKSFFLGGADIGPELTEHNTLGITFAWSGGIWFFTTLAYHSGPWVLLLQLPWCFSIVWFALLFRHVIRAARDRTIHGFLGEHYGPAVRVVAAVATTLGYVVNCGFELFWAALMFSAALGRPDITVPVAMLLAVVTGFYCSIGGYASNAATDRPQNLLGVLSLGLLLALFSAAHSLPTIANAAVVMFCVGAVVYVSMHYLMRFRRFAVLNTPTFQSRAAVSYAVLACVITLALVAYGFSGTSDPGPRAVLGNYGVSPAILVGILGFQFFFNVIDMANWQQIAANGDAPPAKHRELKWSIIRASLYLLWFPALGGTLLGCALRSLPTNLSDDQVFSAAFGGLASTGGEVATGLVLGFLFLGFLATSLSTADSMVMSAVQTLSYDILWRRRLDEARGYEEREERFVSRSRALIIPLSLLMVSAFWAMYVAYQGDVFNFQAMMYAWALTLFGPAVFALRGRVVGGGWVLCGMLVGLASVIVMLGLALTLPTEQADTKSWLLQLMPVIANLTCLSFVLVGHVVKGFAVVPTTVS